MKKIAFIMAGGKGQRLEPFTLTIPKPALPIASEAIISVVMKQLELHGFERVYISLGYKGYLIRALIEEEISHTFEVIYLEDRDFATGTAGALKLMEEIPGNVLVINGDILTDLNFSDLWESHCGSNRGATIAVHERVVDVDFGVVEISEQGFLNSFREKPTFPMLVSMGVNIIRGDMVSLIPNDIAYDMPSLLKKISTNNNVYCHVHKGYWQDLGRLDDFEKATKDFENDSERFFKW